MFWDKIKNELSKHGNTELWSQEFMVQPQKEYCGIRGKTKQADNISIVSHKFSYGGDEDLFEIWLDSKEDVEGFLTEEQVIEIIRNN